MSTLKATNFQHPSATNPAIVLDAAGDATYAGVHDFSAATVTGAPQGLTHINTTTFSAVSSVSLDNVFTSAYDNYLITVYPSGSADVRINLRLRASSTDTTTNYSSIDVRFNVSPPSFGAETTTGFYAGFSRTTEICFSHLVVSKPFLSKPTNLIGTFSDTTNAGLCNGQQSNSTSFDGLTLFPASGTFTGTIRIYGYSNGA